MLETHIMMRSLIWHLVLILVSCLAHTLVLRLTLFTCFASHFFSCFALVRS
jgi:hypothetical protein